MMNSRYLIDDTVLASLLKKSDPTQLVWQVTFQKFKNAFVQYFKALKKLEVNQVQDVFREAFSILVKSLAQDASKLKQTLFTRLIEVGHKILSSAPPENQMNIAAPYLAGEILILLIQAKDTRCLDHLFSQYKEPTMIILKHKYGQCFNVLPQEIYGEAIMILKNNIEQGRIQLPMKSRLFTYFFLIARNKYLELGNKMKGLTFYPDLMAFETKLNPKDPEAYLNNEIESICPTLKVLLDSSNKEVFKKLLNTFHMDEHELLRLRFEEGLRFREIGKRLQLKEATCRKRLHDSIKRWKKQFFISHVA